MKRVFLNRLKHGKIFSSIEKTRIRNRNSHKSISRRLISVPGFFFNTVDKTCSDETIEDGSVEPWSIYHVTK